MKIDVVKLRKNSVVSLASVSGITRFKQEYSNWFKEPGDMYVRYVGKNLIGTWRFIPNKSTGFYRCSRVTSQDLIEKLNRDFITSVVRTFDKE